MVRLLFILVLTVWAPLIQAQGEGPRLRMEFSKPSIYPGEFVVANFVVYSPLTLLEVEVAKFPEFRGFWSENLSLRQGPLPLMPDFKRLGLNKANVGAYLLTPMMGNRHSQIRPMKLVVRQSRFPNAGGGTENIMSEGVELEIKPLPPVPEQWSDQFHGAVGSFHLHTDDQNLYFIPNEPVMLRYHLQGQGNFHEINQLKLPLPEGAEILSRKTYSQGSGQYLSKTFSVTLTINSKEPVVVPAGEFVYFDPKKEAYQSLVIPAVNLSPNPANSYLARRATQGLPLLRKQWSAYHSWASLIWLWALTGLGIVFLFGKDVVAIFRTWKPEIHSTKTPKATNHEPVKTALAKGDLDTFVSLANHMAVLWLSNTLPRTGAASPRTRRELLEMSPLPEETKQNIEALFAAEDRYRYSREKTPPTDPEALLAAIEQLSRNAA